MLFRQFCRLRPTISRGWSWHLVPVTKRRRASRLSLQSDFRRILAQPSSLKHQQRSDKVVPLRDYEISFLFLPLVKFHRSGKSEIYSPVQRIIQCFFTKCYFKLRHRKRRPFISECGVRLNGFQQFFFYFKISMRCWDFNHVIDEVWIPYLLG